MIAEFDQKRKRRYRGKPARRYGATLIVLSAALTACGPTKRAGPLVPESLGWKPISFAILEDYDKGASLDSVAHDFRIFRELGITTWRGSFGWDDYEPARGRYDLDWLERFVTLADTTGITLRPYVGYTPEWAGRPGPDGQAWNDPPRSLDEWGNFLRALVTRLRDHPSLRSYEIYNEENVALWWEGTAAEYAATLNRAARIIRETDPGSQVLLGGMVWPDASWLEASCGQGGAAFDVLPFHAYPETWTPDSVDVENYLGAGYRQFLPLADSLCGRRPIWVNEAGFATVPGKSERQQAEWWVRTFATFLAEPRIEHLGVYEIRDQPQGTAVIGDMPNYYLGLLRSDGTRKLAFNTVKLLVRLFQGDSIAVADAALTVEVIAGRAEDLHHHLFVRPDGHRLVFIWDRAGNPTVDLRLARPGRRVTRYGLDGRASRHDLEGMLIPGVQLRPGEIGIFEIE